MDIPSKGLFITFEGGEGSGKSTQIGLLEDEFKTLFPQTDIVVTREPGGSPGAELIRCLLTTGDPDRWFPFSEFLLFYAARYDHWKRTISPTLRQGGIVICDRYIDSSRIYQGIGRGIPESFFREMHQMWSESSPERSFWPDITFAFSMDPHKGLKRSRQRQKDQEQKEDRFEREPESFHRKINQAYRELARKESRVHLIEADNTIEAVHQEIVEKVLKFLAGKSEETL